MGRVLRLRRIDPIDPRKNPIFEIADPLEPAFLEQRTAFALRAPTLQWTIDLAVAIQLAGAAAPAPQAGSVSLPSIRQI